MKPFWHRYYSCLLEDYGEYWRKRQNSAKDIILKNISAEPIVCRVLGHPRRSKGWRINHNNADEYRNEKRYNNEGSA